MYQFDQVTASIEKIDTFINFSYMHCFFIYYRKMYQRVYDIIH